MTAPRRIQMTRQRPWRAEHPDAVIVARPSRWGNEFRVWRDGGVWVAEAFRHVDDTYTKTVLCASAYEARHAAAEAYRRVVESDRVSRWGIPTLDEVRAELAGRDLACWCPLDAPCHADVLLDLANPAPAHDFDPVHDGCRRCGALPFEGVPCEPPTETAQTVKETSR